MDESKKVSYLDDSAKHNLDYHDYKYYLRYKDGLIKEGESLEDIESILTGFIWDCIESYEEYK